MKTVRVSLLTLAVLVAMDSDLVVLLWLAALCPVFIALTFMGFLVTRRRPRPGRGRHAAPGSADPERWHGEHRTYAAPGRHSRARGRRLAGVSRQAQLEEQTMSMPNPFSWDHPKRGGKNGA